MLEPRESDIPALFLFLVVFPVVTYILLGKWSEASKRKERISLLAQLATEEAQRAEAMAAASLIPIAPSLRSVTHECVASSVENVAYELVASSSRNVTHQCALCLSPATTRCSRCKSVRYCSGKCQIIHWRQGHKQDCQQLETSSSSSSPKAASVEESVHENVLIPEDMKSQPWHKMQQDKAVLDNRIYPSIPDSCTEPTAVNTSGISISDRKTTEKQVLRKSNREMLRRENGAIYDSFEEASGNSFASESHIRHKQRNNKSTLSEGGHNASVAANDLHAASRSSAHCSNRLQSQRGSASESTSDLGTSGSSYSGKNGKISYEVNKDCILDGGSLHSVVTMPNGGTVQLQCPTEMTSNKRSVKSKGASHTSGAKISKSARTVVKASREQLCSEMEGKRQMTELKTVRECPPIPSQGSNGVTRLGIMKMMGLKKSKSFRQDASDFSRDRHEKIKMLFPYEEFVHFFDREVCDLSPRGLLNCGNSCYANAVLQCLTFTKPLVIYLLQRSHSRICCMRNWCLTCELEQHLMMLRDNGGPISPSRILSHMRSINCQMGDGNQEDAHEFLRLLVTSMQSICLEGLGGERVVDPRLQETTFIQHTFGGRLRSKVKCLRCQHESEIYENIMDLTLEILGWVESLEDALTQFTTPEDLDGENMYRCGRCAAYVRARKQLSIHEAPNILTIALKRFQEGRYGKINKCITFPDMLDMIPFMTGTDDIPPPYILYAVVVHLDTLNASFSGHYVAYVKDLQGNWFRIDDAEVQPVPMYQVMSEGAYILFYMRSSPRPPRTFNEKPYQQPASASVKHRNSKIQKTTRSRESKTGSHFAGLESSSAHRQENIPDSVLPTMKNYGEGMSMEFSDATSSDWSIFTSSDDASFTTESTRDSFSTVDYSDSGNIDPISSIFNSFYPPEYSARNPISCRMFSNSKGQTQFVSEEKGYVLDSHASSQPLDKVHRGEYSKQVGVYPTEFTSNDNCSMFVKYGSNHRDGLARTSCNFEP